jgi:CHAD domain-containing protein
MALDRNRLVKPAKKLNKLVRNIGSKPTPEEVHDLRTSTRRFEALFEALSLGAQGISNSTIKNLGRFHKRAGKVRDMDVLTGYAATVRPEGEDECTVRLLEFLGSERRKYAKRLHAEVQRKGSAVRGDLKRTPAIIARLIRNSGKYQDADNIMPNAAATAVKLAVQLAAPERLGRKDLHPYRLKVKELLHVLQLAQGAGKEKFVDDLRKVKDAIGEWHDWEQLVQLAQDSLNHGNKCRVIGELKRIAKSKYDYAFALTETLRKTHFRVSGPSTTKTSTGSRGVPGNVVWQAIAALAR